MVPNGATSVADAKGRNDEGAWCVLHPARQTAPLVFASPHSGRRYPTQFIAASRLDPLALRRSEDAYMDEIYASAVEIGAPLLTADFPRAFVDPNREPFELDPAMFDEELPDYVNTGSPRVAAGLGTIARVVTSGEEIYHRKLDFAEVQKRIRDLYFPYHEALKTLLDQTRERFGAYLLIDCHSMPSVGGPMDSDRGLKRVDFVLGDRFGTSCSPRVTELAEQALRQLGYSVRRNVPYAGGYTTCHYGRPSAGAHALQIEINRALYMDEATVVVSEGMDFLKANVARMIRQLADIDTRLLHAA